MKKFIIIILLFAGIVKLLDLALYHAIDFFYSRTYSGQSGGDINKYLHDTNRPELVIMGSSTTRFQVCPDSFPIKSCNLARAMTEDTYQLGLLLLMIKKGCAPKNVLLSVWPNNYIVKNGSEKQPEDILFLKYYYYDIPFIKKEIDKISYFEKFKYIFALNRFNGNVTDILKYYYITKRNGNNSYFFQYQASTPLDSVNIMSIGKIRKNKLYTEALPLSGVHTKYLPAIIDTCKKYGINLMCYYMPMLRTDSVKIRNGLDFIRKTTNDKGIPYLEISPQTSPDLFTNISYWTDELHANEKGGKIQSAILAGFVRQHLKINQ